MTSSKKLTNREIERLKMKLDSLPEDLNKAIENSEQPIKKQLEKSFSKQQNPYGNKWKSRKHSYSHPMLNRTGNMFRSFKVNRKGKTLEAKNTAEYSQYHQEGTKHMAQRKILPDKKQGLPKRYKEIIEKELGKVLKKKF